MSDDRPTLKRGSTGAWVSYVQSALNEALSGRIDPLVVDGKFGPLTSDAVRLYQRDNGFTVDGIVGPQTWRGFEAQSPIYGPQLPRGTRGPAHRPPTGPGNGGGANGNGGGNAAPADPPAPPPPPQPASVGFPQQRHPHDCGYFAHYAVAQYDSLRRRNFNFTVSDVETERNAFLTKTSRSGHVYLGPSFATDYLDHLDCHGFRTDFARQHFARGSDAVAAGRYLVARLGQSGATIACNDFAGAVNYGHWLAVLNYEVFNQMEHFFVYDSSSVLPRSAYPDGPRSATVAWVPWRNFIAFLQYCNVGSVVARN